MNGIVNFRRRHPVTRLHLLIIVLAVLAVVTPATAPVNAQETVTQTADGATWTLTGETSVAPGSTYTYTITLSSGTKPTNELAGFHLPNTADNQDKLGTDPTDCTSPEQFCISFSGGIGSHTLDNVEGHDTRYSNLSDTSPHTLTATFAVAADAPVGSSIEFGAIKNNGLPRDGGLTITVAITTFVSNTHLTSTSFAGGFLAQSFETGANAGGYSVSEVDVVLKTTSGRSTSVKIRENNVDNEPGELVTNLDNPDTLTANIVNTFTAPAGTTLAASETYWISVNEGISSRATLMIVTSSDETGEPGWSIGDDRLHRGSEGVTAWSTGSDESLMIAVKGTGGGTITLSTDATLSGLALEDGDGNAILLDTTFASDGYEYEASVANGIDAVKLTAAKSNTNAKVVITNDDDQTGSPDEALLDLIVGSNELTVTVTAEDTTTERTYTITVERAATSSLTSDDARLSALSVSPRDIIGFYGPHTSYEVGVDPTVETATVSATVNHPGASLVIYPVDADTAVGGHQVGLLAGSNVVTVSVTAEDGLTKREYTVSVNRGVTDAKGWQAGADLDGLIDGRNEYPRGIWSDETTVWVADAKSEKLFAYTLADGMRDAGKDITLDANNNHPDGIWSNGTTVWVADWNDAKLYAYTLADATRDSDKDITLHADNTYPTGIWADETTMWVADHDDGKLYAYTLSDATRDAGKDFTLHADNADPAGIWSDETTMWVADDNDDKLYAYTLSGGMRDADKDITLPVYPIPAGLWSDGTTMWVADRNADKLYAYTLSGGTREAGKTITLDNNNNNPYEIWSDGTTMWVVENGGTPDIFAYTLSDGMPDADKDITPHHANNDPRGIWSDGTTMWVVQTSGARHIYAYTLADGMRDAGKDIKLRPANANPTGIWSNGTTMWVMDRIDDKLYAYTLVGGMRDSSKDIALHFRNGAPSGIWSNGTTMWVADQDDEKLYAYTLSNAARDDDRDFDTASAGNGFPQGIWSDGTTMWVSDWFDQKVYAYNMPPADEDDATLRLLNLSNVTLAPPFVSGTRSYTASVGKSVTSTTVTAQTTNPNATRVIKLEGTEDADGTVDLAEGDNIITVVVTAEDTSTTLTYTVTVTRAATFSTDATLSSLNLNNFTLDPTFASGTHSYTASVGNRGMSRVTAQTTDPNATRVIKLDGVTDTDGTVDLAEGENSITVVVTAEDTSTTLTYTVTVTRDAPLSNDATLSSLSLSDGTLDPTFMSGTQSYTASVANSVTSTMVTAETTDPNAAEPVIKLDGTEDTDGTVDLAEGDNIITVEVTAEDTTTTLTYQVTVTRATDTANLVLSRSSLSMDEAGSDTFTVKLATLPSGQVTVTVTSDETDAATVSPASLTFTTTNWNSTQTVTVSGVNDSDTDNESLTVTASASGGGYTGKTATVNVDVTDDDTANLVLSRASLSVGEAGSDTFTVKLATLPSANVTVTVSSDDTGAATVSPASLTFTTTNWNTTQQVTVSGEDDTDTANESLTVTASASGGGYGGKTATVNVTVTDDDTANLVLSRSSLSMDEAGSDTFTVKLATLPSGQVTVTVTSDETDAATVSPASLTFTTTNWNSTQTVTVSGVNDSDTDNESLTVTASASGGGYTGKTATVNVDVTDDDTGLTTVTFGASSYTATEGGSSATVVVRLSQAPATQVTIPLTKTHRGGATGGDYTGIPDDVMFTSGQMQRTFTVTAVDDSFDDDGESVRIGFDELPSGYAQGLPRNDDRGAGRRRGVAAGCRGVHHALGPRGREARERITL